MCDVSHLTYVYRHLKDSRGMSFLEIMVALAIISLIMALGGSLLNDLTDADLRDTAFKLKNTIEYVYNESAIRRMYYRLVIDLDKQEYYIESKSEPFLLTLASDLSEIEKKKKKESSLEKDSIIDTAFEKEEEENQEEDFVEVEDVLIKRQRLKSGIKLTDIYVTHLEKKVSEGKVEIYFFPNGWVERAVINITNDEEDHYLSLEVQSATGKSKVREEYFEVDPTEAGEV